MTTSWVEPDIFNGIQYGTSLSYACTPEFRLQRGIELRGPERIHLRQAPIPALPVCGSALLQTRSKDDLVIHVLQQNTGKNFTGVYVESYPAMPGLLYDPISDHERPKIDTAVSADHSSGMVFNINAATTVTTPLTPGLYEIFVTFGDLRSNTVVVEVIGD